jgi:3-isopropylmalate/(R)-2-methylmalate dehydratase small subunit
MSEKILIKNFKGQGIPVKGNDIDTDRIIPARFMKCVTFDGLGAYAFNDERVDGNGKSKGHPFDDPRWAGHPVLVSNANFGCGSSREHAPQALKDYGIQAVIAESFAEIFAGNCSSMGIPAVRMSHSDVISLQKLLDTNPNVEIEIDLDAMTVIAGDESWNASMPEAFRQALRDGSWDSTAVLAAGMNEVAKVAEALPYV